MIRRLAAILGVALAAGAAVSAALLIAESGHGSPGRREPDTRAAPAARQREPALDRRRTFYVSPAGHDSSAGTSPATAWRSVLTVDRARLAPGDTVLFQGGAVFADAPLMPGRGTAASGSPGLPITFGSYGNERARLTQGVWFDGDRHLSFRDLILGPATGIAGDGLQGSGDHIRIERLEIAHVILGIESVGNNWTIADTDIHHTGDSGMLLGYDAGRPGDPPGGSGYVITRNAITDTGLNPRYRYGTHGIYLKVANATVTDNTISHFHDDGISIRYRDNTVTGNHISDGPIGLAWFQYDDRPGTSTWHDNTLTGITNTGIFVCGPREGCRRPLEQFSLAGNTVQGRTSVPAIVGGT
ncbi:MAG: right-handed parallel beta-helix repeat-containing protein [Solirubrobacteraceae bacterium]